MRHNSPNAVAVLAEGLNETELPFRARTDEWWDEFWHSIGLAEAQRIKEQIGDDFKIIA